MSQLYRGGSAHRLRIKLEETGGGGVVVTDHAD